MCFPNSGGSVKKPWQTDLESYPNNNCQEWIRSNFSIWYPLKKTNPRWDVDIWTNFQSESESCNNHHYRPEVIMYQYEYKLPSNNTQKITVTVTWSSLWSFWKNQKFQVQQHLSSGH